MKSVAMRDIGSRNLQNSGETTYDRRRVVVLFFCGTWYYLQKIGKKIIGSSSISGDGVGGKM